MCQRNAQIQEAAFADPKEIIPWGAAVAELTPVARVARRGGQDPLEVVNQVIIRAIVLGDLKIDPEGVTRQELERLKKQVRNAARYQKKKQAWRAACESEMRAAWVERTCPDPSEEAEQRDEVEQVFRLAKRLGPEDRKLFRWRYQSLWNVDKIATELEIHVSTVSKRLQRIHDQLRVALRAQGD